MVTFAEPWGALTLPDVCYPYFAQISWGRPIDPREAGNCDSFVTQAQMTPIQSTVGYLESIEHQPLAGVIAFSFGVVRTAPLWGELRSSGGFLLLADPAAPPGTSESNVAQARAERTRQVLQSLGAVWCTAACANPGELLTAVSDGTKVNGLSANVMAALSLAAVAEPGALLPALKIAASVRPDASQAAQIDRIANSFARTIDQQIATPANVGYRAEMCQAYGGGPSATANRDALARALTRLTGPRTWISAWPAYGSAVPLRTCLS